MTATVLDAHGAYRDRSAKGDGRATDGAPHGCGGGACRAARDSLPGAVRLWQVYGCAPLQGLVTAVDVPARGLCSDLVPPPICQTRSPSRPPRSTRGASRAVADGDPDRVSGTGLIFFDQCRLVWPGPTRPAGPAAYAGAQTGAPRPGRALTEVLGFVVRHPNLSGALWMFGLVGRSASTSRSWSRPGPSGSLRRRARIACRAMAGRLRHGRPRIDAGHGRAVVVSGDHRNIEN